MPNFGGFEGKNGTKMSDFGILGDKNAQFWGFEGKNGSKMPDFGIFGVQNAEFWWHCVEKRAALLFLG